MHRSAPRSLLVLAFTAGLAGASAAQQLRLIADLEPGMRGSAPSSFTMLNGRALFFAKGYELWSTDGTTTGTRRIGLYPRGLSSTGPAMVVVRGRALFAKTNSHLSEFWSTDGTAAGTRAIDLLPSGYGAYARNFSTYAGDLIFTGFGPNGSSYHSLWRTDGTPRGTTLVSVDAVNYPATQAGGKLWFLVVRNRATQLAVYDGQRTTVIGPASGYAPPVALGDEVVFARSTDRSSGLWITDGSTVGTRRLVQVTHGSGAPIGILRSTGSRVFFRASDSVHGSELWTSDGTPGGTRLVIDLLPGGGLFGNGMSTQMLIAGDRAVFTGTRSSSQLSVFSSDGTARGTTELTALEGRPVDFTNVGPSQVWFRELRGDSKPQRVWRTDGTKARTVMAGDAWSAPTPIGVPRSAAMPNGRLLLMGEFGNVGAELLSMADLATTVTVAAGCGNNRRNPRLRMTDPVLGRSLDCFGEGAEPGSVAVLLFGRPAPTIGSCRLNVDARGLIALPPVRVGARGWRTNLPIPANPGLVGAHLAAQAAFLNSMQAIDFSETVHLAVGR